MDLVKLTDTEFRDIAKFVYEHTGIHLPEEKLTLLSNRLRKRLRSLDLPGFRAYYDLLRDAKQFPDELPHFLSAVTTNETYFFRNDTLWKHIREVWLPETLGRKEASKNRSIQIWSAASSSGEESYTAAICLCEHIRDLASWKVRVVASDISQRVLDQAQTGEYNDYAVSHIPKDLLAKYFDGGDGKFILKPNVRKLVTFQFHNLRDRMANGGFDLIFLRNVLMYFDTAMKLRVLAHVIDALAPGGHLVVGDVDPIRNTPELRDAVKLNYCIPNWYQKPDASRTPAPALSGAGRSTS